MSLVRVAAVQFDPQIGNSEHNLKIMRERLGQAAAAGAKLVLFPECALTGYCFETPSEAWTVAEPVPGPSIGRMVEACTQHQVSAAFGLLERDGDRLFNACALVGPNGLIHCYRKIHLPCLGVDRFTEPGDRPFSVVEVAGLRLGLHICYDGSFPESARVMALQGADLIALPTNWPPGTEVQAEHLTIMRAYENTVYTMAINRVGTERGFSFIGRSSIADPKGQLLAFGDPEREQALIADIDPNLARTKQLVRIPKQYEVNRIAHRRPEFYQQLVEPTERN